MGEGGVIFRKWMKGTEFHGKIDKGSGISMAKWVKGGGNLTGGSLGTKVRESADRAFGWFCQVFCLGKFVGSGSLVGNSGARLQMVSVCLGIDTLDNFRARHCKKGIVWVAMS